MVMFKFPISPIFQRGELIVLVFSLMLGQVQSQIMEIPKNSTNSRDQNIFLQTELAHTEFQVLSQFLKKYSVHDCLSWRFWVSP